MPPARPEEYQDSCGPSLISTRFRRSPSQEAIFDLPTRDAGVGSRRERETPTSLRPTPAFSDGISRSSESCGPSRVIFNHTVRYHNPRDLELYALLQPGEDSIHFLEKHGREDLMRYRQDVFDDKYARLRGDRPSKTIVSHLAKDGNGYIHPAQVRSITLWEAA